MKGIAVGIPLKAEMYSMFDNKADIKDWRFSFPHWEILGWKSIGDPALCLLHWLYSKYLKRKYRSHRAWWVVSELCIFSIMQFYEWRWNTLSNPDLQWSMSSMIPHKLVTGTVGTWRHRELSQVGIFKWILLILSQFLVLFNCSVLQEGVWWNSAFSWASSCLESNWFKTISLKLESRMYPGLFCCALFLWHSKSKACSLFS